MRYLTLVAFLLFPACAFNRQAAYQAAEEAGDAYRYEAPAYQRPASLTCGVRPLPRLGCKVGRCVNGQWEQVCP